VFLGKVDGEVVALKVYGPTEERRRMERELNLLAAIDCPNLVKVRRHDWITINDTPCPLVAFEYHPHGDLRRLTELEVTPLDTGTLLRIGAQISNAIEALWGKRIVHRDIKPANIVKAEDGHFVLVDLGLAKHLDLSTITLAGFTVGTVGYMSPEQAQGRKRLTLNSDVFSLGVTLYELAAKRHPFGHSQIQIARGLAQPLNKIRPDLPVPLSHLIHQMMQLSPYNRPRQALSEFLRLLEKNNVST
jgi:eukaryotic-like serine/threonine-protein kinase